MSIKDFAEKEYGFVEEEFGDCRTWLIGMREMYVREINEINEGTATAETFGYTDDRAFIKKNQLSMAKIDEVLNAEAKK